MSRMSDIEWEDRYGESLAQLRAEAEMDSYAEEGGPEMRVAEVKEIVFPHPTVSEVLKEAILQAAP